MSRHDRAGDRLLPAVIALTDGTPLLVLPRNAGKHRRKHEVADDYEVTCCPNDGPREHQIRLDGAVLQCIDIEELIRAER